MQSSSTFCLAGHHRYAPAALEKSAGENHCMFHPLSRQLCINAPVSVASETCCPSPFHICKCLWTCRIEKELIYSKGSQGVRLKEAFAWTGELYKWSCDIVLRPFTSGRRIISDFIHCKEGNVIHIECVWFIFSLTCCHGHWKQYFW